jgi:hypothetical protein
VFSPHCAQKAALFAVSPYRTASYPLKQPNKLSYSE